MVKALIAVTSYNEEFYPDGKKTGLFITEALHPFQVFKAKGYDVDFVSETGTFGYDDHSLEESFLNGDDLAVYQDKHSDYNISTKNIKKASDVDPSEYSIIYFSGGHGTVYDFPHAKGLQKLAQEIYKSNGVVAAVCHGPVIFDNLTDPSTGKLLAQGKKVTGFTDIGESDMGLTPLLKQKDLFTVQDVFKKVGADYQAPSTPWEDFTVVDGKLVTGTNPASASSTAKKAILALSA